MYNPEKYRENKGALIKQLKAMHDAIPTCIIVADAEGKLLYINNQGKELFGLNTAPESQISTFGIKAFMADGAPVSPGDMPISITLKNGETVRKEGVFVESAGGVLTPALIISTPLYDLDGNVEFAFVVIVDMSERRRTEEILNFQKHLLANVKDAIAAYDRNKRVIYWNEAAEKIYGWTEQEMLGRPVDKIFHIDTTDPLREAAIKKALLERSRSGEVFVCRKDGKLLHTEVHTKVIADNDGAYNGAVAVFHDITRRKRYEIKIGRQKNLLQMINAIYEKSLYCDTLEDLGLSCLQIIESATKSSISLVGEIWEDGSFHDIAVSRNGRGRHSHFIKTGHGNGFLNQGFIGAVLQGGQTVLINDPQHHPENKRLPEGHALITSFLGTPFIQNGNVAGIVAVANREGGYTEEEREMLEALAPSVMEVLLRKRAEEALKKSDERMSFLLKLSDEIRMLTDQETIEATASRLLGQHLKSKASYIKCGEAEKLYDISYKSGQGAGPRSRGDIIGLFPAAAGILRYGKTVIVEDFLTTTLIPPEECEQAIAHGVRSCVAFPMLKNGEFTACLAVGCSEPRHWTPLEVSLVQETAERTWTAAERSTAEKALRKREEQFRALVTASSEVLFRMSPDWSVMTQLHGSEKPNSAWFEEYIHPDDKLHFREIISEAIRNKSIIELEHRIQMRDGNTGWAYTRAVPLLNKTGEIIEWFGSTADITGRKKADERLLQNKLRDELLASISSRLLLSENPQRIIYDLCIMAMRHIDCDVFFNYFVDNEKGCLHLNAVTGIPENEAKKFEWLDFGTAVCGCVAQEGERIVVEGIAENSDKRTEDIAHLGITAYACHPLKVENTVIGTLGFGSRLKATFTEGDLAFMNTIAGYIAIAMGRLITNNRLKQSEKQAYELVEQLKKEDQNKNEFLGVLSHELRNPLATIIAGISFLDVTKDRKQEEQAKEIIKRQSAQLCRLVDDLLDITRITQNKIRLKKDRIDLNSLAALAAEDVRPQFEKKGIRLEIDIPRGHFYIEADPARISQIIGNLLHNALKFTEIGGCVTMSVHKSTEEAVISVKDNGIGMKEEMLDRVFQLFIQADESLERSGGGLGIGLAIAKGIAELHGGTICAKSAGLGKGSTFEIRLPADERDVVPKEASIPKSMLKRSLSILLIEDNKDFAELLCSMFRQIGHEAVIAYNGPEGLGKAKAARPDIIFCDIGLPDMNGYEIARLIKGDDEIKDIYLVALTGYAGQQDIEFAARSGFDKHIAKPVNIETLQKVLNQFG